ncbi:MAG TPA: type II toxin-antitoxin system RelE/ParE family toxin [Dissulfurispiraceae bacterium]
MTKFTVHIVVDAEADLVDIYRYVALNDSPEKADKLLDNIERTVLQLEIAPLRGHYPPELERLGIRDYREVFFKPYRIIYQVIKSHVYVHCVLDGRRDLQDLLQQRLLR